jgi:hypothetical protein
VRWQGFIQTGMTINSAPGKRSDNKGAKRLACWILLTCVPGQASAEDHLRSSVPKRIRVKGGLSQGNDYLGRSTSQTLPDPISRTSSQAHAPCNSSHSRYGLRGGAQSARRNLSGKFAVRGQPSLRRILVDCIRQFARQSGEQLLLGQPRLSRERVQYIGPNRLLQLGRGQGLVRSRSYPGLCSIAVTTLLETVDKLGEPAAEDSTGGATGETAPELL